MALCKINFNLFPFKFLCTNQNFIDIDEHFRFIVLIHEGYFPVTSSVYSLQRTARDGGEQKDQNPQDPIVEVITPDLYNNYGADGSRGPFSGIWSRTLRVKITGRDGFEKLDVRIPVSLLFFMGIAFHSQCFHCYPGEKIVKLLE